jgi:hypothetical protein
VTLVLDSGAFLAVERGNRELLARVKRERLAGRSPVTHGGVVGQVWRGGTGRQVSVARLLRGVDVRALDDEFGRAVGMLLGSARASDVVDAGVVLLCADGDEVFTSDTDDLLALAQAAGHQIELISV